MKLFLITLLCLFGSWSSLRADEEMVSIPHVSKKAMDSFQFDYSYAADHKAYAIAPGGGWSWTASKATKKQAIAAAIEECSKHSKQKCVLYAIDKEIVFDRTVWPTLWGPYKSLKQVKLSKPGTGLGDVFPNIEYTAHDGSRQSISDLTGKLVFVHFWGSWCPSCRYEFPTLINLYQILKDVMGDQVELVILQAREPIEEARGWVKSKGFEALPIADSGAIDSEDKHFKIKGGEPVADRKIAKVFPASYVLDKHGVVIFSHMGSISNWTQYVKFFKDAVEKSGK